MNLPIDLVPGSSPPKFRWRQTIDTLAGRTVVEHDGMLPPSVEDAVAALIKITKRLAAECEELRRPKTVAPVANKQPVKAGK